MSETAEHKEADGQEAVLLAFTNNKSPEHMGLLQGLLKMAYHTVLTNRLAIMEALNSETGEQELILVGVQQNGDGMDCYPLFKPIKAEEVSLYHAPDGKGGFLGLSTEDQENV